MNNAALYLIAVPQAQADAARQAAATWDPAGADSMFRNPTLHPTDEPANLYVFSYGWIGNTHVPEIAGAAAYFPGGHFIAAETFEGALTQAGLVRVQPTIP